MQEQVISAREMQRNYTKLINQVNKTKQPIFLGRFYKIRAVLLDLETYVKQHQAYREKLKREMTWKEMENRLAKLRKAGKQNVNLARFIHEDRQRH